jgi:hypothetical protein
MKGLGGSRQRGIHPGEVLFRGVFLINVSDVSYINTNHKRPIMIQAVIDDYKGVVGFFAGVCYVSVMARLWLRP